MIGTASIILMISLGLATDAQFAQMAEEMNLDMTRVTVQPNWGGRWCEDTNQWIETPARDITDESIVAISRLPGVVVATPLVREWLLFRSGPYAMQANVTGIRAEALPLMGYDVEFGRLPEPGEEFAALFSAHTELQFFDTSTRNFHSDRLWADSEDVPTLVDVFNDSIRIYYDMQHFFNMIFGGGDEGGIDMETAFRAPRSFELDVVGMLVEPPQTTSWRQTHTNIYMDLETLRTIARLQNEARRSQDEEHGFFNLVRDGGGQETFDNLFVRVESPDHTHAVAEAILEMGYNAHFDAEWIERQRAQTRGIETLLTAIAIVSLVVAAINIANTMITSVTERTREIGILKVIGARVSDVLKLFLFEAVVIGILGGLLGVGLALSLSYAMNNFDIAFLNNLGLGAPSIGGIGLERAAISLITPFLCLLALGVAAGVGLLSGFFPAWRATRLSALAAIRGD